ncbi:hypothetical protein MMC32_008263 [Xylographa parallela]|nr:hypothetical protein [Xylographa parallela]
MAVLTPQGGGISLVVIIAIFVPLVIASTGLRLWARRLKQKKLDINDYAAILATVIAVAYAFLTLSAVVNGGVGRHLAEVLPVFQTLSKITLALALVWTLANTAVKISVLHLYITIFQTRSFRYAAYFAMFLTAGYAITNCLQLLLICRPIAYNWDKTINGTCSSEAVPFLASACINMGIDVIIVVLPMPMLWRLQMPTQRKVALSVIFGMGALICVLSAIRINAIATLDYTDFSYSVVPDGIYSVLEPCLGVINASLPILQPVVNKLSKGLLTFTRGSTAGSSLNLKAKRNGPSWVGHRSEDTMPKRFQRLDDGHCLDDHVPLTEIHTPREGLIEVMSDYHVQSAPNERFKSKQHGS